MQGDQVDRSGRSSDEEMEKKYQHYSTIKKSLEVLMEQSKNLVKNMNGWSESNRKIGEQLNAFVTSAPLVESAIMEEYRVSVVDFHAMIQTEYKETRRAVTAFLQNRVISVIERLLKEDSGDVEAVWKVRKNILLDYESHLRRASNYEQKKDMEQMNRFELKASHDQTMLEEHTRYLNEVFDVFMTAGSDYLLFCTSSFLTCELFLVKQQFESLASICNNIGEETISPILDDINGVLSQIRSGKAVEQASTVSLPFHLPPKEAIPKYVPFREYVKMENAEKKAPAVISSISDGETDGVKNGTGKEKVKNSDVLGFFEGGEGEKKENPEEDVFGGLMGDDSHDDQYDAHNTNPFGDTHDTNPFGDTHDANPFGDTHDANPFGDTHDANPFGDTHDANPFGDTHDTNPFNNSHEDTHDPYDPFGELQYAHSDDHAEHDFFANPNPLDDLYNLGIENHVNEEHTSDHESEEEHDSDDDNNSIESHEESDSEEEEYSEEEASRPSHPRHVIARASFEGDDPEDLSFEKGDILTVLKVSKSGWWKGKLRGRVGLFPATYVKRYD